MTIGNGLSKLDVVIPTRDRPEQLRVTLEALTRQSFPDFSVIVVDDGSECEIETLIPRSLRDSLGVRFVRNTKSLGPGLARNRGIAESRTQYVVFIDDDCIAGADLIGCHYRALSTGEPVVSLGPFLADVAHRAPVWIHWDVDKWDAEYRKLTSGEITPGWEHLFTGNVGVRRTDFLAVEGFDGRFARGEDIELGYRLHRHGCRFVFDAGACVRHDSQRSLQTWLRIAVAAAHSDVQISRRHPELDRFARLATDHWAKRLVRRLFGGSVAGRLAIACAVGIGVLLHAARADRISLAVFSIVRDLTYWRALQAARPMCTGSSLRSKIEQVA